MPDGGVGNSTFPDDRPGHRVQRDDRGVDSTDEDLVAVQGDAAIHLVAVLAGGASRYRATASAPAE